MDRREFLFSAGGAAAFLAMLPRAALAASASPADAALSALVDRIFEHMVDRSPQLATILGFDKGPRAALKSQLSDNSRAAASVDLAKAQSWLADLKAIDRATLSKSGAINYDVVDFLMGAQVNAGTRYEYGANFQPYVLSQLSGAYVAIPDFLDSQHVIVDRADADAYVARVEAFATALDNDSDAQQIDASSGVFAPDFLLDLTLGQLAALREQPAAKTVLVESIVRRVREAGVEGRHGADVEKLVTEKIFPALDRQIELVRSLRGRAVHEAGVWRLPKGESLYADALANETTTTMTPPEVHAMGLQQVAEISGQIDRILKAKGMTQGTVGERLTALNQDPAQLYANDDDGRAKLLADLNLQVKAMEAKLPQAFATLPKAAMEIRRVPIPIQDGAPNGYYFSAALDGSRPAIYFINLKDTGDWPRYGLPTLSFHEGAPGHHLQIAVSQESPSIPMYRKVAQFNAYVEGWALYAEQLADELGIYADDPFGRVGYLQSFLFRATRLVVDTGLHYKRWSREQATDYMVATTGFARPRVQREIDRYCVWPGQACSYKVGHMAWVKARARAKAIRGKRFDLREFHQVLLEGALPLTVLDKLVDAQARA